MATYTEEQKEEMRRAYEERQEQERNSAISSAAELVQRALEIAAALGAGWAARFEEHEHGNLKGIIESGRFHLILNGKDRIYAHKRYGSDMWDYSGVYPRAEDNYSFNRNDDPCVGISSTKSAARIASDLKSRLFPTMDKLYGERYKLVRAHEQEMDRYTACVQGLELALGVEASDAAGGGRMKDVGGRKGRLYYRFVTGVSANDVKIEVSGCSYELAIAIARMINAEGTKR